MALSGLQNGGCECYARQLGRRSGIIALDSLPAHRLSPAHRCPHQHGRTARQLGGLADYFIAFKYLKSAVGLTLQKVSRLKKIQLTEWGLLLIFSVGFIT